MSEHDTFLFPAAPHLPSPDLRVLEQWMLHEAILLPAVAAYVPSKALQMLSYAIGRLPGSSGWLHDPAWRTAADVVASHIAAGNLPAALQVAGESSVEDCVQSIRNHGLVLEDAWLFDGHANCEWLSPRYRAGPGMRPFYAAGNMDDIEQLSIRLFQVHRENMPLVIAGEGTVPPCVPEEPDDRGDFPPIGDYMDFIGAAYEDIQTRWTHPDSGRSYCILDLDWQGGMGIGWSFIQFEGGAGHDLEQFAKAISVQCGQRMMVAHRHL